MVTDPPDDPMMVKEIQRPKPQSLGNLIIAAAAAVAPKEGAGFNRSRCMQYAMGHTSETIREDQRNAAKE